MPTEMSDHISKDISRIVDTSSQTRNRSDQAIKIFDPCLPVLLDSIRIVGLVTLRETVQLLANDIVDARAIRLRDRRLGVQGRQVLSLDGGHHEFLWKHAGPRPQSTRDRERIRLTNEGNEGRVAALSNAELFQV